MSNLKNIIKLKLFIYLFLKFEKNISKFYTELYYKNLTKNMINNPCNKIKKVIQTDV